jgi:hypothetical protein
MIFFVLIFFTSVFLTFGYSYRLWKRFFLRFNKVINHYSSTVFINFLSLALVIFSITFLWWINFNLLNVPRLFLYVDFFGPLFFIFMIVFLSFLGIKLLIKEFRYKFLVDYLAKNSIYKIKNIKFIDLFLNNVNSGGYRLFMSRRIFNNYYLKRFNFNSLVVLVFIFFIICWGFSLFKNICFASLRL